jgi:hypothetical protein
LIDSQESNFALFEMSKRTNLDIKDTAYLHIIHNLPHPTSRPTTKSTKTTMVNAPKKNISPLSALSYGNFGKSVNPTTSSSESRQERLGGRENPSPWGILQLEMEKEACSGDAKRNAILKQSREREMD